MYTRSRNFARFNIDRFSVFDGLDVIDQLKAGTKVELKSEPENPFDFEAVAIFFDDCKLGYIPSEVNYEISTILYFGHEDVFEAVISEVYPDMELDSRFVVTVRVKGEHK